VILIIVYMLACFLQGLLWGHYMSSLTAALIGSAATWAILTIMYKEIKAEYYGK
jgi:uncharacterized membrane-anchored protein YjiN (DUF445 family)